MNVTKKVVDGLGILLVVSAFYFATIGSLDEYQYRSGFLAVILIICFLMIPIGKQRWLRAVDFILVALTIGVVVYQWIDTQGIVLREGMPTGADLWCGAILIIVLLEASRRAVGWQMTVIAAAFCAYQFPLIANHLPGLFRHGGSDISGMISLQFQAFDGIYGIPLEVASRTVAIFVTFAALLQLTGAGDFLLNLSQSMVGGRKGGPAKIAVVSSAFFGTLSGSAVANVVGTGSFTIPLMKKMGYKPEDAGAVEATASTGGQLMPPVMGAAAFLIAGFLGIKYSLVCLYAAIPAVLYFGAVYAAVHQKAVKQNLRGIPKDQLPPFWKTLKWGGHLLLPLGTIVVIMSFGYTPEFSGVTSTGLLLVLAWIFKQTRFGFRALLGGLAEAGRSMIPVTVACATAGIIIAIVVDAGIGARMSALFLALSGGYIVIILFFAMIGSLILGMGVPTTAAYVIVAMLIAPALTKLGVPLVSSHLFAFYFAMISGLTPPVALAAYAAAPIANAPPFKVGVKACMIAAPTVVVPYLFCYDQGLLALGPIPNIIIYSFSVLLGIFSFSAFIEGAFERPLSFRMRFFFLALSVPLYMPGNLTVNAIAIACFIATYIVRRRMAKATALQP